MWETQESSQHFKWWFTEIGWIRGSIDLLWDPNMCFLKEIHLGSPRVQPWPKWKRLWSYRPHRWAALTRLATSSHYLLREKRSSPGRKLMSAPGGFWKRVLGHFDCSEILTLRKKKFRNHWNVKKTFRNQRRLRKLINHLELWMECHKYIIQLLILISYIYNYIYKCYKYSIYHRYSM